MKTLYLVRHAKSSWGNISLPDFDRPLNDRGKHDVVVMAKRLKDRIKTPDIFISSPAKRAKKTCKAFCEEFGVNENKIEFVEGLYHASESTILNIITSINNSHKKAILFGHNPGFSDVANSLCEGVTIADMPTCSIFAVEADADSWSDFKQAKKRFLFFDYPKASV